MKRFLYSDPGCWVRSIGLLVLRAVVGAAFVFHGAQKIEQPFEWMGPDASVPGPLQCAAVVAEFGGGIALIVGLLTPLAAFGLAATMVVAIVTVHLKLGHPFVGKPGNPSYELAAVYLACMVAFLCLGPGRLSADAVLFGGRGEPPASH